MNTCNNKITKRWPLNLIKLHTQNNSIKYRFFYQKKKFQLPQYVPQHVYGYVLNGFDEIDQWHAESNASVKIDLRRWQTSGSLYFVFTQYRIVSPYHCNTGIEVRDVSY